ncbi:MAG TPA: hypothetical protein VF893_06060 [Candidatus Bathyarchaeia archaeon]
MSNDLPITVQDLPSNHYVPSGYLAILIDMVEPSVHIPNSVGIVLFGFGTFVFQTIFN